jgi:hypothetical protein
MSLASVDTSHLVGGSPACWLPVGLARSRPYLAGSHTHRLINSLMVFVLLPLRYQWLSRILPGLQRSGEADGKLAGSVDGSRKSCPFAAWLPGSCRRSRPPLQNQPPPVRTHQRRWLTSWRVISLRNWQHRAQHRGVWWGGGGGNGASTRCIALFTPHPAGCLKTRCFGALRRIRDARMLAA